MAKKDIDSTLFKNFIEHRFDDSLVDWIGEEKMEKLMTHVENFLTQKELKMEVEIDILKPEGATQDLQLRDDQVYYYSSNKKNAKDENCVSNYDDFKYSGSFRFAINKGVSKADNKEYLYTNDFEFVNHATKVEVKLGNLELRNSIETLEQFVNLGALNTVFLENDVAFNYKTGERDLTVREDPLLFRFDSKKQVEGANYSVMKRETPIGIFSKNKEYGYDLSESQLASLKAGNAIYLDEEKQKDFFKLDAKKTKGLKKQFKLNKAAFSRSQKQQVDRKEVKKSKLKL